MIKTLHYNTPQLQTLEDGKQAYMPVDGDQVLQLHGPEIQVNIAHPQDIIEKDQSNQLIAVSAPINALIDTGATSSIISDEVAKKLRLVQVGFAEVISVQDKQIRPVYFASIIFDWGSTIEAELAACPLQGIDCLIGRDVLMNWNIIYNGKDGFITICD